LKISAPVKNAGKHSVSRIILPPDFHTIKNPAEYILFNSLRNSSSAMWLIP
jgi:heptaprenylglyceryl phosphate synthase